MLAGVRGPLALGRRCGPISTPVPHGLAHGNTHAYQISALLIAAAVPIAIGYSGDALHTPFYRRGPHLRSPKAAGQMSFRAGRQTAAAPSRHLTSIV